MMTNSQNSRYAMHMTSYSIPTHSTRLTRTTSPVPSLAVQSVRSCRASHIKLGIVLWLVATLFASVAHAAKAPIYTSYLNNTAVGGYDVVSYFQGKGEPVKGKAKFKTIHQGADWLFASQENLVAFTNNPEKYQPQFGGYCAFAVARGSAVKGDPLQYHVSNGKLYLNYNAKFKKLWLEDKAVFIEKGNRQWPSVLD